MILIIDTNFEKESLHYLEFVKPIINIVEKITKNIEIKHYHEVDNINLEKYSKIIICGTALKNNQYLEELYRFGQLKSFEKPILGICSGAQIIAKLFGNCEIEEKQEIGKYELEIIEKDQICENINSEIYCLHNLSIKLNDNCKLIAKTSQCPQIIKFGQNKYSVVFHPEVRQDNIIKNFINHIS